MKMWHLRSGFPLNFTTDDISNIPAVSYFGPNKAALSSYALQTFTLSHYCVAVGLKYL